MRELVLMHECYQARLALSNIADIN